MPDLKPLGNVLESYVQTGDFNDALWPFIPKATLIGLFDSILAGNEEFYHLFLGKPIDPTQHFEVARKTKSPTLIALVLREINFRPPTAPRQIWNWRAIIKVFPEVAAPIKVRIQEVPGETTVPGADFNATFRTTRETFIRPSGPTISADSAFTQGYFVTFL